MKNVTIKTVGRNENVLFSLINGQAENVRTFKVAQKQKAVALINGEHNDSEPLGFANELGIGNRVGFAQFLHRTVAIDNEVGQVIVGFNPFNTTHAFAQALKDKGFNDINSALNSDDATTKKMAQSVKDIFESLFSVKNSKGQVTKSWFKDGHKVEAYSSAIEETAEERDGQDIVHVNPLNAVAVINAAKKMDPALKLDEVIRFSVDMGAVKRMFGEKTIDSDKKVDATILAGIPLFEELSQVKQLGRKAMSVSLDWESRSARTSLGGNFVTDKAVLLGERYLTENNRYQKPVGTFDYVQALRLPVFERLTVAANKIGGYRKNDVQRLPDSELAKISSVAAKFAAYDIKRVVSDIKQEWLTISSAIAGEMAALSTETNAVIAEAKADVLKADRNRLFGALSNKARLVFDSLEKVSGQKVSSADRVRLVWDVVLGVNPDWAKLSNIASSLLPEEYLLWVLELEDDRIVRTTKDAVKAVGALKGADVSVLNGKKVRFNKGVASHNGAAFLVSDVELDGIFTIVVEGKDIFAAMDIKDVVKVPAANKEQVTVRTITVSEDEAVDKVISAASKGRIAMMFGSGNPLVSFTDDGDNVNIGGYVCRANKVSNQVFKGDGYGVIGRVTFAKVCAYDSGTKKTVFMIVDEVNSVTKEEAEVADIPVTTVKAANFDARALLAKMFG